MRRDVNNSSIDQKIPPSEYQNGMNEYLDCFFKKQHALTYGGDTLPSWDDADRAIKKVISKSPDAFYQRLVHDISIGENVRHSLFEKLIDDYAPLFYASNNVLNYDNYMAATLKFVEHEESLLPKKQNRQGFFSSIFLEKYPNQTKINDLLRLLENISPDAIKNEDMKNQAIALENRLKDRIDPATLQKDGREGIELKKGTNGGSSISEKTPADIEEASGSVPKGGTQHF
jgi:hypothetical protein